MTLIATTTTALAAVPLLLIHMCGTLWATKKLVENPARVTRQTANASKSMLSTEEVIDYVNHHMMCSVYTLSKDGVKDTMEQMQMNIHGLAASNVTSFRHMNDYIDITVYKDDIPTLVITFRLLADKVNKLTKARKNATAIAGGTGPRRFYVLNIRTF